MSVLTTYTFMLNLQHCTFILLNDVGDTLTSRSMKVDVTGELCLFPSVTGDVYCFPRQPLIFSFGRRLVLSFII